MLDNATIEALLTITDGNPWGFTQVRLEHTPDRRCEACGQLVECRESTGLRWVCPICAHTLWLAAEQRGAVPA